jgi:hypothetical protein
MTGKPGTKGCFEKSPVAREFSYGRGCAAGAQQRSKFELPGNTDTTENSGVAAPEDGRTPGLL